MAQAAYRETRAHVSPAHPSRLAFLHPGGLHAALRFSQSTESTCAERLYPRRRRQALVAAVSLPAALRATRSASLAKSEKSPLLMTIWRRAVWLRYLLILAI